MLDQSKKSKKSKKKQPVDLVGSDNAGVDLDDSRLLNDSSNSK